MFDISSCSPVSSCGRGILCCFKAQEIQVSFWGQSCHQAVMHLKSFIRHTPQRFRRLSRSPSKIISDQPKDHTFKINHHFPTFAFQTQIFHLLREYRRWWFRSTTFRWNVNGPYRHPRLSPNCPSPMHLKTLKISTGNTVSESHKSFARETWQDVKLGMQGMRAGSKSGCRKPPDTWSRTQ